MSSRALAYGIAHAGYDLVECSAELLQMEAAKASERAKPCSVLWYRNFVTMVLYRRSPEEFDLQTAFVTTTGGPRFSHT